MFVGDIKLKQRITHEDMLQVFELSIEAEKFSKKGKSSMVYRCLKDVLRIVTELKNPKKKHVKKLNEIMEAHGLIRDAEQTEDSPKDARLKITKMAAWFGAHLNKSPYEILTGFTADETQLAYNSIILEKINHYMLTAMGHHDPGGLDKELKKMRRTIREVVQEVISAKIQESPVLPSQLMANFGKPI